MKVPTDYEILDDIYDEYYETFAAFSRESPTRSAKIFVPIDVRATGSRLGVDGDIIFGRLYYHLEQKFGYVRPDGSRVYFFSLALGDDKHCINFPLLGAVLAGLRQDRYRNLIAVSFSIASLVISAVSATIAILSRVYR
jgi:hypothetical protein